VCPRYLCIEAVLQLTVEESLGGCYANEKGVVSSSTLHSISTAIFLLYEASVFEDGMKVND
jgi:hypothetical protein